MIYNSEFDICFFLRSDICLVLNIPNGDQTAAQCGLMYIRMKVCVRLIALLPAITLKVFEAAALAV